MKHLKLFEKFAGDGEIVYNSISDRIDSICKKYGIVNYTINKDGTVDVSGDVNLSHEELMELPLKFGKVTGNFYCNHNNLKSLDGSPSEVGNGFSCNDNLLTTLEGGPSSVGRFYNCSYNQLYTLEGSPNYVPQNIGFYCSENPISNIYNLFGSYKEYQDSLDHNYLRGKNIIKFRLKEALEEIGKTLPDQIEEYNYIWVKK